MHQRWESLLFVHWTVSPSRIQETLPPGLTVDTFNNEAYLAIVPFFMRNVRPVGGPALPWVSAFQELNVRTYVYDRDGVPGVWFYSLDCNQPLAVIAAKLSTGLPYRHARMSSAIADSIDYRCQRNGTPEFARFCYAGIGEAREPAADSLESFLLDRYYLYAMRRGALIRAQVSHERYRYRAVELADYSTTPLALDGFGEISGPPMHRCYVDGFDVKIYGTQRLA